MSPEHVARYLFGQDLPGGRNSNVFLENGGRLYLDTGFHPEYATPECDDPRGVVIYDKAGERIVHALGAQCEARLREQGICGTVILFKNNTDCVGNSYGCHENYLVSRLVSLQRLAEVLIPFLVTRQIFAGAGKVLQTPKGFRYSLSQRAEHIVQEVSGATTSSRSIINTRDEPLADKELYRRLHLILGDSNMSEVAGYLKVATTALVLDMIEDGLSGGDVRLDHAVHALRSVSRDPSLREPIRLKSGRLMTALEVQMEYLERATCYAQRVGTDEATKNILARWADILVRLESDPWELGREVDWVIKRNWLERYMDHHRLSWKDSRVMLMDLQYHDVRPDRGIYYRLAARGQVDRITDDAAIETATQVPPQSTRARLRGEFVRRAKAKGKDYRVEWTYLKLNGSGGRTLHCNDPFKAEDEDIERTIRSL
jgi:proteasome accessory factor A